MGLRMLGGAIESSRSCTCLHLHFGNCSFRVRSLLCKVSSWVFLTLAWSGFHEALQTSVILFAFLDRLRAAEVLRKGFFLRVLGAVVWEGIGSSVSVGGVAEGRG